MRACRRARLCIGPARRGGAGRDGERSPKRMLRVHPFLYSRPSVGRGGKIKETTSRRNDRRSLPQITREMHNSIRDPRGRALHFWRAPERARSIRDCSTSRVHVRPRALVSNSSVRLEIARAFHSRLDYFWRLAEIKKKCLARNSF